MFSLNFVRVFVLPFIVLIFGLNTKKLHFLSFELHTSLKRRSSASEMFELNNISNFEALMKKSIFAFTTRLSNSKNAIICTIQRSWVIRDLIWKVWTDKLYF